MFIELRGTTEQSEMPRGFLFPNGGGLNFGYLQRYHKLSTPLALVAMDPDGIEHIGFESEHHNELALSDGRIDGRLWRWESMRTSAQ